MASKTTKSTSKTTKSSTSFLVDLMSRGLADSVQTQKDNEAKYGTSIANAIKQQNFDNAASQSELRKAQSQYATSTAYRDAVLNQANQIATANALGTPQAPAKPSDDYLNSLRNELLNSSYNPMSDNAVVSALNAYNAKAGSAPTWNGGQYEAKLADIVNQIANRDKFSYDLNGDALYQQYKQQYMNLGNLAMMDTMGQASAMTGGYGNSYASTVGNQAYQSYLSQLNDRVPELYNLALQRYNNEGNQMIDTANMYQNMYNNEYSAYQNAYNSWFNEAEALRSNLQNAYDRSQNQYNADLNRKISLYNSLSDEAYRADRDVVNDAFTERGLTLDENKLAEQIRQNDIGNEQWEKQFNYNKGQDALSYQLALQKLNTDKTSQNREQVLSTYLPVVQMKTATNPNAYDIPTGFKPNEKTNQIESIIVPKNEFSYNASKGGTNAINGKTYKGDYQKYVDDTIKSAWDNGYINDEEAAYLIRKYL